MAVCNIIIFFFLIIVPFASPLSFNLSSIGPGDTNSNINLSGAAYISDQGIQVTPNDRNRVLGGKVGRATYVQPLQLWEKASGMLADFTTHFSFVIDSSGSSDFADGLTFFLVPLVSDIPPDSGGGSLGLATRNQVINASANQFVAVEFDTFTNPPWDPPGTHVGININSMNSSITAPWRNNITLGRVNDAWITYNSSTENLLVVFTGFSNNVSTEGRLNYTVNLRQFLPEKVTFGFSAATGDRFEQNNVKSWVFNSSLDVDQNETIPRPPPEPSVVISRRRRKKIGLVVGLSVGLSVLVVGLAKLVYVLYRKRNREEEEEDHGFVFDPSMENEFEKGTGPRKFSYRELAVATSDFAEEVKLGEGGFGGVYRGFSRELNSYIAVKRVSRGSKQGLKEYASEVKIISRLRHRNLVQLIGWCHEQRELLLVYEFMPNGSLDLHLFKGKSLLTWETRYKIAKELASALLYLHEGWEQIVVHRDIKSSNVMLDSNFNAKLGDFGLARFVDHEKGSQTTVLAGTMGYMAPECVLTGKASKESDVYSFGIVALEIACGRTPIDGRFQEGQIGMVEWVWKLYGERKLLEAADAKLNGEFDYQQMERLIIVGLWCAHPDNNHRPSIRHAIQVLNFEAALPILPSNMPVPTYFPPCMNMPTSFSVTGVTEGTPIQSLAYSYNTDSSNLTTSSSTSYHRQPFCTHDK